LVEARDGQKVEAVLTDNGKAMANASTVIVGKKNLIISAMT